MIKDISNKININDTSIEVKTTEYGNIEVKILHANNTNDCFILGTEETAKLISALMFVRYT